VFVTGTQADPLDSRIERLLQEWNQGTDMLFSIHPVDGSFLVWLVSSVFSRQVCATFSVTQSSLTFWMQSVESVGSVLVKA